MPKKIVSSTDKQILANTKIASIANDVNVLRMSLSKAAGDPVMLKRLWKRIDGKNKAIHKLALFGNDITCFHEWDNVACDEEYDYFTCKKCKKELWYGCIDKYRMLIRQKV
jgi:hypothetical protein